MVEFNLLPDIKLQFLRVKRLEHLVIVASVIVGAVALTIFIFLLLAVEVGQKVILSDLTNEINSSSATLTSNKNLNQILTVQHQLETIPKVEAESPKISRLFSFISQLTPVSATISTLDVNFTSSTSGTANTVTITGDADSLATVNTYVDTIKYATYDNSTEHTKNNPAFSGVVLSAFNYSNSGGSGSNSEPAQYTINFDFDPTLFNSNDNISLVVPSEVTTRSILNQPALFKALPKSTTSN